MAISGVHYRLLKEHAHLLKRGGSLLEIGEANWYGDMLAEDLMLDLYNANSGTEAVEVRRHIIEAFESDNLFRVAKAIYRGLFAPSRVDSIDINGTEAAWRRDLNQPIAVSEKYDVVINHGTAEHIFNIGQVFQTIHHACVTGGYMIHESPFTGWVDHGFYTLQPTLFYDLAHANEYELISLSIAEIKSGTVFRIEARDRLWLTQPIPDNAILFVVMRKTVDKPFRIPMQGVYDGRLSAEGRKAWHEKR